MTISFRNMRSLPILDVCAWLGIRLKKKGSTWRSSCPVCKHKSQRCFVVSPHLGRFWCHGICDNGGDCLQLVVNVKGIGHVEAARQLRQQFGGS